MEFLLDQIIYIICLLLLIAVVSYITKIDSGILADWTDWILQALVGGLLTFFVLITFLNYYGYY